MIARVGELGLQIGISPGLPSSRVLGGLPPQSPHLCNGNDLLVLGLREFREGTLSAQKTQERLVLLCRF